MADLLSQTAYNEIPSGIRSSAGLVGYQSFRPSADRLEEYQEQFAQALAHSDSDPARAAGVMAEIRLEATDYVAADVQDYRRDVNFELINDLRQSGRMNDAAIEHHVLMEKVSGHWHAGRDALNEIRENNGYDGPSAPGAAPRSSPTPRRGDGRRSRCRGPAWMLAAVEAWPRWPPAISDTGTPCSGRCPVPRRFPG